ncbi:MAG: tRNA (adenosine(37)-N6)-threonylcarbamoyltransferase complex dimerization subunit type 1 TsaB [Hydrotalea sp.]|nr:tRNA (adenosine(37)-N6)-threonylcarbamoyltransferase complex dimerization subunit type 1 TsaB [Hydrotalea sp.]
MAGDFSSRAFSWPLPQPLLCFDTAGNQLLVALAQHDGAIATERQKMVHGQAEELLPAIEKILHDAQRPLNALRGIFITLGPGSFTGLRVAVAAAIGLGFGLDFSVAGDDKKIHGIGSLPAMLLTHIADKKYRDDKEFLVLAESRRDEIFYQRFILHVADKKIAPIMPQPMMARRDELLKTHPDDEVVTGDVDFARLLPALQQYNGQDFITDHIMPIYARNPDARALPRPSDNQKIK